MAENLTGTGAKVRAVRPAGAKRASAAAVPVNSTRTTGPRVLIVDADEPWGRELAGIASALGYLPTACASAAQAAALLARRRPRGATVRPGSRRHDLRRRLEWLDKKGHSARPRPEGSGDRLGRFRSPRPRAPLASRRSSDVPTTPRRSNRPCATHWLTRTEGRQISLQESRRLRVVGYFRSFGPLSECPDRCHCRRSQGRTIAALALDPLATARVCGRSSTNRIMARGSRSSPRAADRSSAWSACAADDGVLSIGSVARFRMSVHTSNWPKKHTARPLRIVLGLDLSGDLLGGQTVTSLLKGLGMEPGLHV